MVGAFIRLYGSENFLQRGASIGTSNDLWGVTHFLELLHDRVDAPGPYQEHIVGELADNILSQFFSGQ